MFQRQAASLLAALWITFWSAASPLAAQEGQAALHLQVDQAREVALNALRSGQPRLAFAISDGLLKADESDGHALYIKAKALGQLQDYDQGRRTAAKAYRAARTDLQRFESATLAAQLSFSDEKMTHSQLWLRRAAHFAPDETMRDATVNAFRKVRYRNPVNLQLSFSASPSDNVNNGSNSPFNIIDGSPLVGTLSPSAQAIKGTVFSLNMQGSYRVAETDRSQTRLVARAYLRHIEFNNPVPGISSSDLASQRLQLGIAHIWAPGEDGYWRAEANAGRAWYAGSPFYDFLGVTFQREQKLTDTLRLSFGGGLEHQFDQTVPITDATVWSAITGLTYQFTGGSKLGARALYRQIDAGGTNRASQQWTGMVTYTLGRQIGPAKISVNVGHSTLDYDSYSVVFPVPGGRVDRSWFGELSATLSSASYMGFAPVVSVRSETSRSNISRFDVDQTGVSFGLRSEF
jgi:hypothetical protein